MEPYLHTGKKLAGTKIKMINDEVKMNHNKKRKNKKDALDDQEKIYSIEIGKLFKTFRKTINKAQHELASELNIEQTIISNIERGKYYPNIKYLNYLYKRYGLNINWLCTGKGEMFIGEEWEIFVTDQKYSELFNLMQVPDIELQILAKLTEAKILLKDNIKNYKNNEKKRLL